MVEARSGRTGHKGWGPAGAVGQPGLSTGQCLTPAPPGRGAVDSGPVGMQDALATFGAAGCACQGGEEPRLDTGQGQEPALYMVCSEESEHKEEK